MYLLRYQESSYYDKAHIKKYWCTSYCQQRGSEALGYKMKISRSRNPGGFHPAKYWMANSNYPTGDDAKPGSIACWQNSGNGHVAFVEECYKNIDGSWHIYTTQASSKSTFIKHEYDVKVGCINSWISKDAIFQGFIYLPVEDIRVERDTKKNQVKVLAELLLVRKSPYGDYTSGLACPKGYYNILDIQENGGVSWAKLEEESWIMLRDNYGWTKTLLKDDKKDLAYLETLVDELESKVDKIKEEIKRLK